MNTTTIEEIIEQIENISYEEDGHVDLSGYDLSGMNLGRMNFRNGDFAGSDLTNTKFGLSDFSGWADFSKATAHYTDFTGANLTGANFTGTDLLSANFSWASLRAAKFDDADIDDVNFTDADLYLASLEGAKFRGATLDFSWKVNSKDHYPYNDDMWMNRNGTGMVTFLNELGESETILFDAPSELERRVASEIIEQATAIVANA